MGAIPASALAFNANKEKTVPITKSLPSRFPNLYPGMLWDHPLGLAVFFEAPYNEVEVVEQAQAIS